MTRMRHQQKKPIYVILEGFAVGAGSLNMQSGNILINNIWVSAGPNVTATPAPTGTNVRIIGIPYVYFDIWDTDNTTTYSYSKPLIPAVDVYHTFQIGHIYDMTVGNTSQLTAGDFAGVTISTYAISASGNTPTDLGILDVSIYWDYTLSGKQSYNNAYLLDYFIPQVLPTGYEYRAYVTAWAA